MTPRQAPCSWLLPLLAAALTLGALAAPALAATPSPRAVFEPVGAPVATPGAPTQVRIDERPLWELYHAGRYAELKALLNAFRYSLPSWQPPALLVQGAARADGGSSATRPAPVKRVTPASPRPVVVVRRAPVVIVYRAAPRPAPTSAPSAAPPPLRTEQAVRERVRRTPGIDGRLAALREAFGWMDEEALEALLVEELTAAAEPATITALRSLLGDYRVLRLGRALAAKDDPRATNLALSMDDEVSARKDAAIANALGWLAFRAAAYDRARRWFERAMAWNPRAAEARLGLARTLGRQGQWDAAQRLGNGLPASDPRRLEILGALALDQAVAAYDDKRYFETLDQLSRAERLVPLPVGLQALRAWANLNLGRLDTAQRLARALPVNAARREEILRAIAVARATDAVRKKNHDLALSLIAAIEADRPLPHDLRVLKAWTLYNKGLHAEAADMFAVAFDEQPELAVAEGLYLSAGRAGRPNLVDERREQPLMQRAAQRQGARDQFARGNYAAAAAAAPELYPGLDGLDEPSLALGLSRRSRSGQPGLGSLQAMRMPLSVTRVNFAPAAIGWLQVDRFILDSGELPANANAGQVPATPSAYAQGFAPTPADVLQPIIHFEWTGQNPLKLMLGTTPMGGPLPSAMIWDLAYFGTDPVGSSKFQVFGRPVVDSRLSLIGMRDPYVNDPWGRVVSMGVAVGRDHKLSERDEVGGDVQVAYLQGAGVADNDHEQVALHWKRQIPHPMLEAAHWGIDGMVESYRRNLAGFTKGNGGYWSPQFHGRMRLGFDARTRDLQPFILQARLGVGPGYAYGDPAPFFPLAPDGRQSAGYDRFALYYDAELRATTHLTDWAHAGASVIAYKNAGFDEQVVSLYIRLLSSARTALVADDLDR